MNTFPVQHSSPQSVPEPSRRRRSHGGRVVVVGAVAAAVVLVGSVTGFGADHAVAAAPIASTRTAVQPWNPASAGAPSSGAAGGYPGYGYPGSGGFGGYGSGDGQAASPGAGASAAQAAGVVIVETDIDYGQAEAAGTGMVLTSDGEILTNNHVVEGSTQVQVEVASTGAVYPARVVGTDATDDVAVLQLQDAQGLTTARVGESDDAQVGEAVTAVGDADGHGTLVAAPGQITGLNRSITTQAEQLAASESLTRLIETDADIEPGDSGGPLYDGSGQIIGMDTAASSSGAPDAYAIPISEALDIAGQIEAGSTASGIVQGTPAFLGVQVTPQPGIAGAGVAGVISDSPAASAGLTAGDTIVAVGGSRISSTTQLSEALGADTVGQRVPITWMDAAGQAHTATVALAAGPAA